MEQRSLSEFNTTELKALAYDQMAQIELAQQNLRAINQELARRLNPQGASMMPQNGPPPGAQVIDPLPPGSIQQV